MSYEFGHLEPWWNDDFKNLNYIYYPLKNTHDEKRWIEEGYGNITLNGGVYNMDQPMPDYAQPFFTLMPWDNVGIAFYQQTTLQMLPLHQDSYISFRRVFNIEDPSVIWRCIVFLEDWRSGHYFEIDNKGFTNWKKGDYVFWNYDVPHFAANIGLEPRYTMQITGMKRANNS